MFVRWQTRKIRTRNVVWGEEVETETLYRRVAQLVENRRVKGKVRQVHIAYLGSLTTWVEDHDEEEEVYWNYGNIQSRKFWDHVYAKIAILELTRSKKLKIIRALRWDVINPSGRRENEDSVGRKFALRRRW